MFTRIRAAWLAGGVITFALAASLTAQQMQPTPSRRANEGEGPFSRLVIRGITVIDGTGAPPRGPMDVVVEQGVIREVASVGFPKVPITARRGAQDAPSPACQH